MYDNESLYSIMMKKKKNKANPVAFFEKVEERRVVSYYDENIFFIRILQIVGLFPISRDKNGRLICHIYSPLVIHCILVFIAVSSITYYVLFDVFKILASIKISFDEQILFVCVLFSAVINFIPLFLLFEREKIRKYFEHWDAFKADFVEITGRPLLINLKKSQLIFLLNVAICTPIFSYFLYNGIHQRFNPYIHKELWYCLLVPTFNYYGFLGCAIIFLWYLNSKALRQGAKEVLKFFQECKETGECSVFEMNRLWLRLQDLCCELGETFSYTMLFFLFFLFVIVMLVGYSAIAVFGSDHYVIVGYIRYGLFVFMFLFMSYIPNLAHLAVKNVVDDILNFVIHWAALERNPLLEKALKWMAENAVIKRPVISLAGYVNLNRSVNVSMYAAMVTYFVVVFQFKVSKQEEEQSTTA